MNSQMHEDHEISRRARRKDTLSAEDLGILLQWHWMYGKLVFPTERRRVENSHGSGGFGVPRGYLKSKNSFSASLVAPKCFPYCVLFGKSPRFCAVIRLGRNEGIVGRQQQVIVEARVHRQDTAEGASQSEMLSIGALSFVWGQFRVKCIALSFT